MTIYKPFDIVEVPFPFSDIPKSKRRPALVISKHEFNRLNENSILMMITSTTKTKWHNDVQITEWKKAGLKKPCIARFKIFTLDNSLIAGKRGELQKNDKKAVIAVLQESLPIKD